MRSLGAHLRRAMLPVAVFCLAVAGHFVWVGFFPEQTPAQDQWATVDAIARGSWLRTYIETQSFWLGLSYALPLAFAAAAIRAYREGRRSADRNLAIGGVTLTGVLAAVGCFLVGCCGSPMLAVYASLFGARFLGFAKPIVFLITAASVAAAWWWMRRRSRPSCGCESQEVADVQESSLRKPPEIDDMQKVDTS